MFFLFILAKLKKDKSRRETASGNMSEVSLNTSGISIASSSDAIQEAEPTLKRKHSLSQSIDEPRSTKQKMGTSIKMETSEITLEDPVVSTSCEFEAVQVPTEQPLIICNVASLAIKPELVIRAEFAKFCRRVNPFKCMALDCNFSTAKLSEMKEHVLEHKGCKGSLKCAYCLVEARNVGDLVKHLKETHKNDIFQCRNCFYLAEDSIAIEEHNKTQHPMENLKIFFVKLNLD